MQLRHTDNWVKNFQREFDRLKLWRREYCQNSIQEQISLVPTSERIQEIKSSFILKSQKMESKDVDR